MNDWRDYFGGITQVPEQPEVHSCFCVGPQDGNPVCPCQMRSITIENGRYIQRIDHGPVRPNTTQTQGEATE